MGNRSNVPTHSLVAWEISCFSRAWKEWIAWSGQEVDPVCCNFFSEKWKTVHRFLLCFTILFLLEESGSWLSQLGRQHLVWVGDCERNKRSVNALVARHLWNSFTSSFGGLIAGDEAGHNSLSAGQRFFFPTRTRRRATWSFPPRAACLLWVSRSGSYPQVGQKTVAQSQMVTLSGGRGVATVSCRNAWAD